MQRQGRQIVGGAANAVALRLLARHTCARDVPRPGGLGEPAFGRVTAFIEENVGQHLSLGQLAAVAGVSRFHFARQFRLRTGESPMAYVLRSRVERAKQLLEGGGTTIGGVAAALGFADQSHFTRTFRRLVGSSPSGFARACRRRAAESTFFEVVGAPGGGLHSAGLDR
ncbi:helix-turn-helix domain-containing protein [Anaeromyxobacter terrae]|uniref:helix-turn-helix domain-containing protein n=1 Tax=Anaeromyxobacter terrae TaxID=2925406 RepID=UPI001F56D477|nr:AraC family transcriptional regulator [Anaeromyxobacter sp. SG22]